MWHVRGVIAAALLAVLALASGCGGPSVQPVAGKVNFDGVPVAQGDIIFRPQDAQQQAVATKIQNGQFQLEAPPGKYKVEIRATRATDRPDGVGGFASEPYIPAEYNDKTTLEADVQPSGTGELSFDLKSK